MSHAKLATWEQDSTIDSQSDDAINYAVGGILDFLKTVRSPAGIHQWNEAIDNAVIFLKVRIFEGWAYGPEDGELHAIAENILNDQALGPDRKAIFLMAFIQGYISYRINNTVIGYHERGDHTENRIDTIKAVDDYNRVLGEILKTLRKHSPYPLPAANDDRFRLSANNR